MRKPPKTINPDKDRVTPTLTTKPNFYIMMKPKGSEWIEVVKKMDDKELIRAYSLILKEMKQRKIIRSKNVVADIGEQLVVNTYNKKPKFPKLQLAPEGTQNVDALSRNGERYSIKTTTLPNRSTGVFYGLEEIESKKENTKNFEHVIIVVLDDNLELVEMIEISWETFIKMKKWHKRMKAWYLNVTDDLRRMSTIIIKE